MNGNSFTEKNSNLKKMLNRNLVMEKTTLHTEYEEYKLFLSPADRDTFLQLAKFKYNQHHMIM